MTALGWAALDVVRADNEALLLPLSHAASVSLTLWVHAYPATDYRLAVLFQHSWGLFVSAEGFKLVWSDARRGDGLEVTHTLPADAQLAGRWSHWVLVRHTDQFAIHVDGREVFRVWEVRF